MELRIQYLMCDSLSPKHVAQQFGGLDRDRTYQYRLILCMCFFDFFHDRTEFFFLGHIYRVIQVDTLNRTVCRNLDNVHTIDLTELLFLCQSRTSHTCFFRIFVKEVLECNGGQCFALTAYLYMLFRLNRLMQTVGISSSRHDTSGKLINDQYLIVLYDIILVTEHQVMGTQCKDYIVLDLQILRICQVFNMEEFLYFLHTFLGQVYYFIFFIDDKITGLDNFLSHDSCHLGHLTTGFTTLQLSCQNITDFIQLGGLSALSGNDQRSSRLIDQYRVNLIDDRIMQLSLYQLLFINNHVVSQIVKTILIIGNIRNITCILFPSLVIFHRVQDHTDFQSQKLMDFTHPLRISFGQVIVDGYDMHAFTFQRVQISRTGRNQSLTFTCSHLRDTPLMQNNTTDQLYPVMLHIQHTLGSLTHRSECLRKQIIQRLSLCQSLLELSGLILQLLVRHRLHSRPQLLNLIHQWHNSFQLSGTVRSKDLFR